jgi:hypothetical protein
MVIGFFKRQVSCLPERISHRSMEALGSSKLGDTKKTHMKF